jgi:hypothetical protein
MTGNGEKKVLVAVIDSGINTHASDLENYVIQSTGYGVNSEGFISEFPDIQPNGIHGTAIALIIRDICKNVQFISINILDKRLTSDSRIMIYAMNEALKLEPDIIHMSLGTTNWRYRSYIKKIVSTSIEKKIIIFAYCKNVGLWSYPASIRGVVRIKSAKQCEKYQFYKKRGAYYAPYTMIDIDGANEFVKRHMVGTSIAAAYITGHIANILSVEGKNNINETLNSLDKNIVKF